MDEDRVEDLLLEESHQPLPCFDLIDEDDGLVEPEIVQDDAEVLVLILS